MLKLIENTERAGLCMVGTNRYITTNNKNLPDYDPQKESNYLIYEYAKVLCLGYGQMLPYKGLKFGENYPLDMILNTLDNCGTSSTTVDLNFSVAMHDELRDFPSRSTLAVPIRNGRSRTEK